MSKKTSNRVKLGILGGTSSIAILFILVVINSFNISSQNTSDFFNNDLVYQPNSTIFGKNYSEWSGQWWAMIQNFPTANNPIFDISGERCNIGQSDNNMFFLMGTTGGKVERECTVSSTKSIFIPSIAAECSDKEDTSLDTLQKRKNCVYAGAKNAVVDVSINGKKIQNISNYWFEYALSNFTLIEDNIWGVTPGIAQEYTGGYYIILKPLPPGEHEVHFSGVNPDISGTQTFAVEVTYRLNVV